MARGISSSGDVLRTLSDGTDLNQLWGEFTTTLDLANAQRSALVDLFTFRTTAKGETVLQSPSGTSDFEEASEYGVPQSLRAESATLPLGYTFRWFDLATRYTWKYLADASASQVSALHNAALEADNRLTFKTIMSRLFSPVAAVNEDQTAVYGLWNGTDGQAPPPHYGNTFDPTHTHYLTSGTATLDPGDVELLTETVREHGYGDGDGQQLVILAHPSQVDVIAGWRAGVLGAKFDFIPSDSAPAYLTAETLVGNRPPSSYQGLPVRGSYGRAYIVESPLMPSAFLVSLATGGSNADRNPIALREHTSPTLQGLTIVRGPVPDYPIIDAYYVHGLGAGTRHRSAAAVMQITAGAYAAPSF